VACFAPPVIQERWARVLEVPTWTFTLPGAGGELFGGYLDLASGEADGGMLGALSAFLVAEGLARLCLMALGRRPVGSVLGWPLRSLWDRWFPEEGD